MQGLTEFFDAQVQFRHMHFFRYSILALLLVLCGCATQLRPVSVQNHSGSVARTKATNSESDSIELPARSGPGAMVGADARMEAEPTEGGGGPSRPP